MASRAGKLTHKYSRLTNLQSTTLRNDLRFDPDDIPYVEVASVTPSGYLVSEESDYTHEICEYLEDQLGISVLTLDDAVSLALAP